MKKIFIALLVVITLSILICGFVLYQKGTFNREKTEETAKKISDTQNSIITQDVTPTEVAEKIEEQITPTVMATIAPISTPTNEPTAIPTKMTEPTKKNVVESTPTKATEPTKKSVATAPTPSNKIEPTPTNTPKTNNKVKTIVIDPGHQKNGDSSKEPIGPGATEMKAKVTTGATGVSTKQLESELNLKVSMLLQKELQNKGYKVIMTRTSQDVNLSNSERAEIANNANADVFVRIHADSVDIQTVNGMSTLCQTKNNPYNSELADKSYNLSKLVLDNMSKITGAKNRGVTKTDTMSGINWAKVPTTIIEMGFLSNPEEDKLLASADYQAKIVKGIVNGIEEFLH